MQPEIILTLILAIVQVPIGLLGTTMPKAHSRVPPTSSAIAALAIILAALLFWGKQISGSEAMYFSFGATAVSVVVAVVYIFRGKHEAAPTSIGAPVSSRRAQAQIMHQKIIELDDELEQIIEQKTSSDDWRHDPSISGTIEKLQVAFNNLGYLVNSREYDRFVENYMLLKSKRLQYHQKSADSAFNDWGRARINAKLRDFVYKIKR